MIAPPARAEAICYDSRLVLRRVKARPSTICTT